jgi:integral membrane protein (TIGR00529 family)
MDLVKLLAVLAIIIIALKFKLKLWQAIIVGIASTVPLWQIPSAECGRLIIKATTSWSTISTCLVIYVITMLQKLLEERRQLKLAQEDLNGLFNNRRINGTVAPMIIGLLPSSAATMMCGELVEDAVKDDLDKDTKSFVTSYFRHIPESFLPTYPAILIMSQLSGVAIKDFVLGMLPLVCAMFAIGWFCYIRPNVGSETGMPESTDKKRDAVNLLKHLWPLIAIIVLVLVCGMNTLLAAGIVTALVYVVYRFRLSELPRILVKAFEVNLILSTYLCLVFKEFISFTGVIKKLPEMLGALPIPMDLIFGIIFFIGSLVVGSTAIVSICTSIAFTACPAIGWPFMVMLHSYVYAAMQFSPTHVCLFVATDYFGSSFGGIVKKTFKPVGIFMVVILVYYLLLTRVIL